MSWRGFRLKSETVLITVDTVICKHNCYFNVVFNKQNAQRFVNWLYLCVNACLFQRCLCYTHWIWAWSLWLDGLNNIVNQWEETVHW